MVVYIMNLLGRTASAKRFNCGSHCAYLKFKALHYLCCVLCPAQLAWRARHAKTFTGVKTVKHWHRTHAHLFRELASDVSSVQGSCIVWATFRIVACQRTAPQQGANRISPTHHTARALIGSLNHFSRLDWL